MEGVYQYSEYENRHVGTDPNPIWSEPKPKPNPKTQNIQTIIYIFLTILYLENELYEFDPNPCSFKMISYQNIINPNNILECSNKNKTNQNQNFLLLKPHFFFTKLH